MPRPLHDDVDYRNALGVLGAMAGFEMNGDQEDYFEAIATFVEKYETENHSLDGKQAWALVQPRRGACALATGASPWNGTRGAFQVLLFALEPRRGDRPLVQSPRRGSTEEEPGMRGRADHGLAPVARGQSPRRGSKEERRT